MADNVDSPINAISLFSGGGGLDLGIRMAVSGCRVVAYVEREAYACEVLASRMDEGRLDPAPIWADVTTFDGRPFRGVVDLIAGGFPCQDISSAGLRAGIDGARSGLWSEYERIVREVGPRLVFVENVSDLLVRGIERVLGDLASLGFDAEWGVYPADEVGAPHKRERVFILAHAGCSRLEGAQYQKRHVTEQNRWEAEPEVGRVAHGVAHFVDRLRLLGNGVVPQQAALAFRELAGRAVMRPRTKGDSDAG